MNTLVTKPIKARNIWFSASHLHLKLNDGREIDVPLKWFPRLSRASSEELNNWRLIGTGLGIHWVDLDEDLSISGILKLLDDKRPPNGDNRCAMAA